MIDHTFDMSNPIRPDRPKVAIFGSHKAHGGISRRLVNMIQHWDKLGVTTDLVAFREGTPPYPDELPETTRFVDLKTSMRLTTIACLWRYIREETPTAVLATNHIGNVVLSRASSLPGTQCPAILSVPNSFGASLKKGERKKKRKLKEVSRHYEKCKRIIAISNGVKNDLIESAGIDKDKIEVIYNAVVTRSLIDKGAQQCDHAWLSGRKKTPVICSAGRLCQQKDYSTLLRAFAILRKRIEAKMIILGEGKERERLEQLARELGIDKDVDFSGFKDNPYPYIRASDVFVLSSLWEGLGNVLVEALALGTDVVSTDCPSGPSEILKGGGYGKLVPLRDPQALADALWGTLHGQHPEFETDEAIKPFRVDHVAEHYLACMGVRHTGTATERPASKT